MTPLILIFAVSIILSAVAAGWLVSKGFASAIPRTPLTIAFTVALALLLAVLAVTGLPSGLREDSNLGHNSLMIHVTAGGLFLGVAAVAAIYWGRALIPSQHRLHATDPHRAALWLLLLATLAAGLPVTLLMTTIFDSVGQKMLLLWHEIAATLLLAIFIAFATIVLDRKTTKPKGDFP